jgi:hypothetical protein
VSADGEYMERDRAAEQHAAALRDRDQLRLGLKYYMERSDPAKPKKAQRPPGTGLEPVSEAARKILVGEEVSGPRLGLDALAKSINTRLNKSHDYQLSAAQQLVEAKRRIEAGEGEGVTFEQWCEAHIKTKAGKPRSLPEVLRFISFANSPDPEAAVEKRRAQVREAKRTHDERQRSGLRNPEQAEAGEGKRPEPALAPTETHGGYAVRVNVSSEEHGKPPFITTDIGQRPAVSAPINTVTPASDEAQEQAVMEAWALASPAVKKRIWDRLWDEMMSDDEPVAPADVMPSNAQDGAPIDPRSDKPATDRPGADEAASPDDPWAIPDYLKRRHAAAGAGAQRASPAGALSYSATARGKEKNSPGA